jgi:hypothetical protein
MDSLKLSTITVLYERYIQFQTLIVHSEDVIKRNRRGIDNAFDSFDGENGEGGGGNDDNNGDGNNDAEGNNNRDDGIDNDRNNDGVDGGDEDECETGDEDDGLVVNGVINHMINDYLEESSC